VASKCGLEPDETSELAESVSIDLALRQSLKPITRGPTRLWLGDLCSTESRLALQVLGVKRVCTIASHKIDELWKKDGIEYMTAVVSPTSSIGAQLERCVTFLTATDSIVCCSSGIGVSTLVAAAVLVATSSEPMDAASALEAVRSVAVGDDERIDLSEDDRAELQSFCDAHAANATPTLKPSGPTAKRRRAADLNENSLELPTTRPLAARRLDRLESAEL